MGSTMYFVDSKPFNDTKRMYTDVTNTLIMDKQGPVAPALKSSLQLIHFPNDNDLFPLK